MKRRTRRTREAALIAIFAVVAAIALAIALAAGSGAAETAELPKPLPFWVDVGGTRYTVDIAEGKVFADGQLWGTEPATGPRRAPEGKP